MAAKRLPAKQKSVKVKKVVEFRHPLLIVFGSDDTEATYQETIVNVHKTPTTVTYVNIYVYKYTKAKQHHPVVKSTKLGTELRLKMDDLVKAQKSLYTKFFYELPEAAEQEEVAEAANVVPDTKAIKKTRRKSGTV